MATQATSVSVSGNFTLTDSTGSVVFTFSPSFTTLSDTSSGAISTGEILTNGTSDTLLNLPRPVAVKPDGDVIANLKPGEFMFSPVHIDGAGDASTDIQLAATTAAQKVQFLLCDGPNTGINTDD